jgi:acyl-[acyl-carrier-protein] desaturase
VLQSQIVMPAQNMGGAGEPDLFEHFSAVAQRLGVYTAEHYAQIVTHLVERWRVESLAGLTGEAAAAQEYVCTLGPRYRRLAERASRRATPAPPQAFSWIFDRTA